MKVKTTGINRKKISWLLEQDFEVKLTALQHHLDISRMLVNDILEDEVNQYSGYWYSHLVIISYYITTISITNDTEMYEISCIISTLGIYRKI